MTRRISVRPQHTETRYEKVMTMNQGALRIASGMSARKVSTEAEAEDVRKADEDEKEDESEEASIPRSRSSARAPTEKERAEHNVTHLPYRNWCPICVAARGTSDPHRSKPAQEHGPEVAYDYCFLRNAPLEDYAPVLVSKDRATKILCAHVVPQKGAEVEWIRKQCLRDLAKVGHHGRMIMRSDQEVALVDLLKELAKARSPAETVL